MSKVSTAGSGAKDPEVKGSAVSVSIGLHLIGTISLGAVGSRAVFHRSSVAGLIAQLVRLFIPGLAVLRNCRYKMGDSPGATKLLLRNHTYVKSGLSDL